MKRRNLAFEHKVRTLCMLAYALGSSITVFHSLGMLSIAYARAALLLIALSTIVLCGVMHQVQSYAYSALEGQRRAFYKSVHYGNNVPVAVHDYDTINVPVVLILRDAASVMVASNFSFLVMGSLDGVVGIPQATAFTAGILCVLLVINYVVDVVLRTFYLAKAVYSKRNSALGEHEQHLLRNVSTNLQAIGTADTLLRG